MAGSQAVRAVAASPSLLSFSSGKPVSLVGSRTRPPLSVCSHPQRRLNEVHIVKAMVFPEVMYGYKSWTIKKAEHGITDALDLWCWRRLLRVPWTARRSNQSIPKEICLEYSLEGLMLNLQYFLHLMQRVDSLEKTHVGKDRAGGEGDDRR